MTKSAERPSPEQHAASLRCSGDLGTPPPRITIVDDFVTRGSTLLASAWVLAECSPEATIRALAVVRTMSGQDVTEILSPIDNGRIYLRAGVPGREP